MPRSRASKDAARLRRLYYKKSGVSAFGGETIKGKGDFGNTRKSVVQASIVVAAAAAANASKWSVRIPLATYSYGVSENEAAVVTDAAIAPMAAVNEFGERHPVFGPTTSRPKPPWVKQKTRAYMSKAVNSPAVQEAAMRVYSDEEIMLLSKTYGYDS